MDSLREVIGKSIKKVELAKQYAVENEKIKRELSQLYFFSAFGGGCLYFVLLAGRLRQMSLFKTVIFFYGLNPIMKISGTLGILLYANNLNFNS